MDRGWKPNAELSPACPRCGSANTKFCYYNNYSLTQPRYFCKGCRRYWTKGGSLRNVPVGGGCRKSRRGKPPIRISNDRLPSRSYLAYGNASSHNGNSSTSSSMVPDGPNIDLALVYANFLNRKPEPEAALDPPFDFSSVTDISMDFSTHLPLENRIVECSETHLADRNAMYLCGFDSIFKQEETIQQFRGIHTGNNGLPPLPGEEVASDQETAWSNAPMVFANDLLHSATQVLQPGIELPEAKYSDDDHLIVDRSSFNFSSFENGTTFLP